MFYTMSFCYLSHEIRSSSFESSKFFFLFFGMIQFQLYYCNIFNYFVHRNDIVLI
jgi:hypothetical protein